MTRGAPVSAVLVGAGFRGRTVYAAHAREHPERLRIVAVADPDRARRDAVAAEHGLPAAAVLSDWKQALEDARASAREALEGHLLGFAAERSRALGRVVELPEYREHVARAAAP